MIETLKQIFKTTLADNDDRFADNGDRLPLLAATALMLEIIAIDDKQHDSEKTVLRRILSGQFKLAESEIDELIADAEQAHHDATDYHRFTAEINQQFSAEQKIDLIESLWRLAWADEDLHQLEQHVIRRLANLLHLSHKDFIASKIRVMEG